MKKSTVSLALCAALLASAFAGCGETAEITYDTTTWKSDATKHWHAATNGDESLKGDVDGHSDSAKDGKCDVCGYEICAHTYADVWSYDETNHWYAATCGCAVKKDEAAHTLDDMGDCTVCGADVSNPDVSTIEKAMAIATAQKGVIAGGTLTTDAGYGASVTTYQFFENYTFVKGEYSEKHYSLSESGDIIAVDGNGYQLTDATEDNMNGPTVSYEVADEIGVFCGAEGLVNGLYELAKENANADAVINQEATDGVYSFSFGYYIFTYGLYQIEVEFTIDEKTFAIATVDVESVNYSTDSIVGGEGEDGVTTYTVKEGADVSGTSTVSYVQDEVYVPENPYSEDKIAIKDFAFTVYDETIYDSVEVSETTIETGNDTEVVLKAVAPESGLFSLATIEFSGENVTAGLWAESGLLVKYTEGENCFYLHAINEGEYELTVTVNGVAKTLKVTAVKPVPSVVMTGTIEENYGWQYFYADYYGAGASIAVGESYTLIVAIDKGAGVTITADEAVSVGNATVLSQVYDGEFYYENLVVYAYAISSQTAGVYEITITATDNADATAYFTLTVEEGSGEVVEVQSINVTTTDTYGYNDEYTFTATQAGTYTFNVPAGLGMYSKTAYDAWADAEVDFNSNATGASFSVELAENEEYIFYVGATTTGDWTITYTVSTGSTEGGEGTESGATLSVGGSVAVTIPGGGMATVDVTLDVEAGTYQISIDVSALGVQAGNVTVYVQYGDGEEDYVDLTILNNFTAQITVEENATISLSTFNELTTMVSLNAVSA